MKNQFNKTAVKLFLTASFIFSVSDAAASVSFDTSSVLSFSVTSITGDNGNLSVSTSFLRSGDGFPSTWTNTTGDASVTDNNPEIPLLDAPLLSGNIFSHTLSMHGAVTNGNIDFNQVGWYDLGFNNGGTESVDIALNISYQLFGHVIGNGGSVSVSVNYADDLGNNLGTDLVEASSFGSANPAISAYSSPFSFTLAGGESKAFYIDVNHVGYLEAAPVPLPAAVWSFLAGLLSILGFKKRKPMRA